MFSRRFEDSVSGPASLAILGLVPRQSVVKIADHLEGTRSFIGMIDKSCSIYKLDEAYQQTIEASLNDGVQLRLQLRGIANVHRGLTEQLLQHSHGV